MDRPAGLPERCAVFLVQGTGMADHRKRILPRTPAEGISF
jgi:hypothetical protein